MFNWKHDYHMTDVVKTNKTKISMHNTSCRNFTLHGSHGHWPSWNGHV